MSSIPSRILVSDVSDVSDVSVTTLSCEGGTPVTWVGADVDTDVQTRDGDPGAGGRRSRVSIVGRAEASDLELAADAVPGFVVQGCIGRGGMGTVWRAVHAASGEAVAIKVLHPSLAADPVSVSRFEKEAAALAVLDHPHVVRSLGRGRVWSDDRFLPFLIMEFVNGGTLRAALQAGSVGPASAVRLTLPVARAMAHAHVRGVIHRDLKPENILLTPEGGVKVADFGLAAMRHARDWAITDPSVSLGTAYYMAPEQRTRARVIDGRADIFALGVILYEILTGTLPQGRFPLPCERIAGLDPGFDTLILRTLDMDPDVRYPSADALVEALRSLRLGLGLPSTATLPVVVSPRQE